MVGDLNAVRVRRRAGLGNKKTSFNNLPKSENEILKNQEVQIPKYNQTQSTNQEEH